MDQKKPSWYGVYLIMVLYTIIDITLDALRVTDLKQKRK